MEELELFREDSEEQLQLMENALVDATENGVDEEHIGAVFRAMHTIKGSAGMFGYDGIVEFTHIAENLMSEVRNGEVKLDEALISLFFEVKDYVARLVELSLNEQEIDEETRSINDSLVQKLLSFMPAGESLHEDDQQTRELYNEAIVDDSTEMRIWHISIRLSEEFFRSGMDILSIFHFFNKTGEMIINVPIIDAIPTVESIDPLGTYLGFEVDFMTDQSFEEIEEIFEFILDDVELDIFPHDDLEALKSFVEKNEDSLIALLVDEGVFSEVDVRKVRAGDTQREREFDLQSIPKEEVEIPKQETSKAQETSVFQESKEAVISSQSKPSVKKEESKETKVNKSFSLRVDSAKIDQLMNQISEMVIANAKVSQIADNKNDSDLEEASGVVTHLLEEIRSSVMNIRMVQVEDSFIKFRRIVHDVAKKLGKDIDFVISGGETELDKTVVEKISDPLLHMLRNSIDHGIEMPHEREVNAKAPKGRVDLKAYPDAGMIVIEIVDDGRGLDPEKIFQSAVSKGVIEESSELSEKEIFDLIFAPGFSTAKEVSDISGRGVGMDVVKRNIEELRGTVEIKSEVGKGTKFTVRLPLTLAIIDGFLVQAGNTKYVIPLEMIQECIELTKAYKEKMKGNHFINLRGEILPIFDIRKYFSEEISETLRENIVVVKYGEYHIGLQVDELYGEYHTVIKPLGEVFEKVPGVSGGSILGSGEVALIFDIPALIDYYIRHQRR